MGANLIFYETVLSKNFKINDKYLLVRHEDFAMEPTLSTEKIYKFIGHETSPDLLRWVNASTSSLNSPSLSKTDAFGTTRNSKLVTAAWRKRMSFEQMDVIQTNCGNVMQKLGYKILLSEKDLKNESISTFF